MSESPFCRSLQETDGEEDSISETGVVAAERAFSMLRTRDRERKLIKKIEKTLKRIEDDDFGFCDSFDKASRSVTELLLVTTPSV